VDEHRLIHEDLALWQGLTIGQEINVVKLDPHGTEAARYPGKVVAHGPENGWIAVRALWTYKRMDIDGLVFEPGSELIEWFSPRLPFNAFAVLSPTRDLRGWYANVTYPAYLERTDGSDHCTLFWHDLYLDLVGLENGRFVVRDEDELAESGLEANSPRLHAEVVQAAEDLTRRFTSRQMPFRLPGTPQPA
jgi:hypothetical protein